MQRMSQTGTSALLLLIIAFVAACRQTKTAGARFVAGQSACLPGASPHDDEYINPFSTVWTLHLRKSWCVLSLVATVYNHQIPFFLPAAISLFVSK